MEENKQPSTEDMQAILDALLGALKLTETYSHVESLECIVEGFNRQLVRVTSGKSISPRYINVTFDSGGAMVRDVIRQQGNRGIEHMFVRACSLRSR